MFNTDELKLRRRQLVAKVDKDAIIILTAASECYRNGDVYYPYRQDSDFYYLTAFPEPDAVALLLPDTDAGKLILFNRPHNTERAIWEGPAIGQERAKEEYGADEAYSIEQLEAKLPAYLADRRGYYSLGSQGSSLFKRINSLLAKLKKPPASKSKTSLSHRLHEMRLRKSLSEIDYLRKAAALSAQAHRHVMQVCRPTHYEYQLEAELLYQFYEQGCRAVAYPSIVASGSNACILHYTDNNAILKSGDLVLIDAGCEYRSYASDITRTFPVNGQFSSEQKAIYALVLKAQKAIIDLIKPGVLWDSLQKCCVQVITEGLLDLGLLKGEASSLIEEKAYKKFYMHGCSHWLGLDVHDVGSYKQDKKWRPLEENMVFTVEPGIYIPQSSDIDKKWWNMGVRIEDDVRVTGNGCEVFSAAVPKEISEIESLMRS